MLGLLGLVACCAVPVVAAFALKAGTRKQRKNVAGTPQPTWVKEAELLR